jgi:hypothetical protein
MTDVRFEDKEAVDRTIAQVRDAKSTVDWAVFGYKDNNSSTNTIVVQNSGTGGLSALVSHLQLDHISYCLLRVIDIIDDHPTVKFVYIRWIGQHVKVMQKAKTTTHKGGIERFIGQFHVSLEVENVEELSNEIVMSKVQDASGSANRVLNAATGSRVVPTAVSTPPRPIGGKAGTTGGGTSPSSSNNLPSVKKLEPVKVPDDKSPLAAVRADANSTNWALYSYENETSNIVAPVGQGSGGLDELKCHLTDNQIYYGLLRVTDYIDERPHTKFVYIYWMGEAVKPTRKAIVTTHKGAVSDFIGQYHVAVEPTTQAELTMDAIMCKVKDASGSAIRVKEGLKAERVHLSGGF